MHDALGQEGQEGQGVQGVQGVEGVQGVQGVQGAWCPAAAAAGAAACQARSRGYSQPPLCSCPTAGSLFLLKSLSSGLYCTTITATAKGGAFQALSVGSGAGAGYTTPAASRAINLMAAGDQVIKWGPVLRAVLLAVGVLMTAGAAAGGWGC